MQANKYPGTCGCGKRVTKGRGFIQRVGDGWGVHCSACPAGMAAAGMGGSRKRKSTRKGPSAKRSTTRKATGTRKARPAAARPRFDKAASKRFGAAKGGAGRRRTPAADGCRRIAPVLGTPDWSLHFTPLSYGGTIRLADGSVRPCTPEYARIAAEAVAAANGPREMDLLVTLVEMRALGHLGEPGVPAVAVPLLAIAA